MLGPESHNKCATYALCNLYFALCSLAVTFKQIEQMAIKGQNGSITVRERLGQHLTEDAHVRDGMLGSRCKLPARKPLVSNAVSTRFILH